MSSWKIRPVFNIQYISTSGSTPALVVALLKISVQTDIYGVPQHVWYLMQCQGYL